MISRENFCKIFDSNFVDYLLDVVFCNNNLKITENFVIWYDTDFEEITILNKDSLFSDKTIAINWYKPYHVGRALQLSGIKNIKTLKYYRDLLVKDLEYEEETV